jgi:hypothetical protein
LKEFELAFLDTLLSGGSGYVVTLTEGGASFQPVSNSEEHLEAFQQIVTLIRMNEGDGYSIYKEHATSDRGVLLIDRVVISTE